jgi:glycosyltransferase involved in cell wall biosynthesis
MLDPAGMKSPVVSVVIPCFNAREFVSEAIDSAFSQEVSWDIEVIVVDDGSTGGTWEELLRIRRDRHARLQVLSHPGHINLGASASRYRGLLAASGIYIAFLDADDIFLSDKLALQLRS